MTVRSYRAQDVVFNYGDQGSEYFVIARGRVSIRVPTKVDFSNKSEYLEAIADHYDNVLWRTVDDFENVRFLVQSIQKERTNIDSRALNQEKKD